MSDAEAQAVVSSWPIPGEQSVVYHRTLDYLRNCDLPADIKLQVRAIVVEHWKGEVAKVDVAER